MLSEECFGMAQPEPGLKSNRRNKQKKKPLWNELYFYSKGLAVLKAKGVSIKYLGV